MRVLLIEDDSATAQSIELMLQSEGFNVYTTDLGEEGADLGKLYDYDIILLDLNLPDMSGYEVLKTLRVSKVSTPILILSGLAGIEDKVRGLGFGADDYMTKPFHKDELVARIHAIVRRSKGHAQSVIETGNLKVNLDTKTVEVEGQRVHLTGKEYQMLELLSLRKGTTLTKEMFLNHLYGGMDEPELKIIDVFICKLRKKLQAATGGHHYIETVWGRGYVLRDPGDEGDPSSRGGGDAPLRFSANSWGRQARTRTAADARVGTNGQRGPRAYALARYKRSHASAIRLRWASSGWRPRPAATLFFACCGLAVPGMTQVTAGWPIRYFSIICAQLAQSISAAQPGSGLPFARANMFPESKGWFAITATPRLSATGSRRRSTARVLRE
jgi:two-component system cell cycle response regulator CtrA